MPAGNSEEVEFTHFNQYHLTSKIVYCFGRDLSLMDGRTDGQTASFNKADRQTDRPRLKTDFLFRVATLGKLTRKGLRL